MAWTTPCLCLLVTPLMSDALSVPLGAACGSACRRCLSPVCIARTTDVQPGENLWAILDVAPQATEHEIRKAFRRQARALHPDVNPSVDASRRFRRLVYAHEVLSNSQARREWEAARRAQSRQRSTTRKAPMPTDGELGRWGPAVSYILYLYLAWYSLLMGVNHLGS